MSQTYCSTLNDAQVQNVYDAERNRMQGLSKSSKVYQGAKELAQEAREELTRRGLL